MVDCYDLLLREVANVYTSFTQNSKLKTQNSLTSLALFPATTLLHPQTYTQSLLLF